MFKKSVFILGVLIFSLGSFAANKTGRVFVPVSQVYKINNGSSQVEVEEKPEAKAATNESPSKPHWYNCPCYDPAKPDICWCGDPNDPNAPGAPVIANCQILSSECTRWCSGTTVLHTPEGLTCLQECYQEANANQPYLACKLGG